MLEIEWVISGFRKRNIFLTGCFMNWLGWWISKTNFSMVLGWISFLWGLTFRVSFSIEFLRCGGINSDRDALIMLLSLHKKCRVWSFSGLYFPAFGLNTDRYDYLSVFSPNAGKCGLKTPNTDTYKYAVFSILANNVFPVTKLAIIKIIRIQNLIN